MDAHVLLAQGGEGRDQGFQMIEVAVHAAVGDKAHEMHPAAGGARRGGKIGKHSVGSQFPLFHGDVDAGHVLVDDPSRADVHVTDLGVAHEAVGQAHGPPRTGERRARVGGKQPVQVRGPGQGHGVARAGRGQTPAVEDEEQGGRHASLGSGSDVAGAATRAGSAMRSPSDHRPSTL
ncbi:hypothetical protein DSECCO2_569630 [anaerobic digester metagenome]